MGFQRARVVDRRAKRGATTPDENESKALSASAKSNLMAFKPLGERGPTVWRDMDGIAPEHVAKLSRLSFSGESKGAGCCARPSSDSESSLPAVPQQQDHPETRIIGPTVDRVGFQEDVFENQGPESLPPKIAYLQGLDPQAPLTAQFPADAGCCCCAVDLDLAQFTWLEKVEPNSFKEHREIASKFDDSAECGHFFIVKASIDYQGQRPLLQSSDCQLRWWERTTVNTGPQSWFYPPNTWYEVTLPGVTSSLGWEKRHHPGHKKCPGTVVVEISDRPALVKSIVKGVGRTVDRTLDWYIVLSSAPKCRCRTRNVALRLMQRLVLKEGVVDWSQSGFLQRGKIHQCLDSNPSGCVA